MHDPYLKSYIRKKKETHKNPVRSSMDLNNSFDVFNVSLSYQKIQSMLCFILTKEIKTHFSSD